MKTSRFSEQQIAFVLRQAGEGNGRHCGSSSGSVHGHFYVQLHQVL